MDKARAARMASDTLPADNAPDGVSVDPNRTTAPQIGAGRGAPAETSPNAQAKVKARSKARGGSFEPPPRVDEVQLLRSIGRGAMGQIFLGRDTVLDRSVAVKFIATQPTTEARERFLTEARAIARLHHPNVVGIFRVGEIEGHPYLVSEFVDGESLDKLEKPLPWVRALQIALGLVSGLSAAHRQGVLHRDIKSANVMLARDGTVKLLDFGLAKLSDSAVVEANGPPSTASTAESLAPISQSHVTMVGALLGTPAYMAPESWLGDAATERTDIYSLGALLYELCTGQTPHPHEELLHIRRAAIERDAAPLAHVRPDVHPKFAEVIDRCLRRDPAERYASAADLLHALETLSQALAAPRPGAVLRQELKRRWPLALLAAALLIVAPVLVVYSFLSRGAPAAPTTTVTASNPRRAVLVLGMTAAARAPQLTRVAAALSELLIDELAAGERLRGISPDSVTRMRMELALAIDDPLGPETLARVHRYAGADLVVTGAIEAAASGELTVRAVVKECPGGKSIAEASASGSPGDLFHLVEDLGAELRQKLGAGELSEEQVGELRASRPESPEAAQLFTEGQERLRHFDLVGARDILARGVAAHPDYAAGHFALAGVWSALGYDVRAREEAERAFRSARHLPREPRILFEARYRELNREWDQALSLYRSLVTFFPDNIEYGLYLANAQVAAGQLALSLDTVSQLRLLPAPASNDPRIGIAQATVTFVQGDYPETLSLLNQSIRQGEEMNAPHLVAKARLELAYLYEALGQHKNALRSAAEAQKAYAAAGDQAALADTLTAQGSAYSFLGQLDPAVDAFGQALSGLLEIENNAMVTIAMGNLAIALCKQGKLDLALARAEAALMWGRELDFKESVGAAELVIGWIATSRGQLDVAEKHLKKAEKAFAELGDPRLIAWIDFYRGQLYAAQGRLAEAAHMHEGALDLRERHNLSGFAAESRAALAEIALERGEPAEAADFARSAAQQFRQDGQLDNEALALALLGSALIELGRADEAGEVSARASTRIRGTQNTLIRVQVSRLLAESQSGERSKVGDASVSARAEAARALLALGAEARALGMIHESMRIELALCRTEAALGHKEEAATRSLALSKEAREKGLRFIAEQAAEMPTAR